MTLIVYISWIFSLCLLGIILYLLYRYIHETDQLQKRISEFDEHLRKERGNQSDIIFRNMHDHVNPMLRYVMRNMERHRIALVKNHLTPQEFEQDIDILLTALNDIRSCTHDEIPDSLKKQGYVSSLAQMLERVQSQKIKTGLENTTSFGREIPFDKMSELDIYRISSEVIENIVKHSGCSKLKVFVGESDECLNVNFIYDGNGLTDEKAEIYMKNNKGTGLQSCKARATLLKADLNYTSSDEQNNVKLSIPFQWRMA